MKQHTVTHVDLTSVLRTIFPAAIAASVIFGYFYAAVLHHRLGRGNPANTTGSIVAQWIDFLVWGPLALTLAVVLAAMAYNYVATEFGGIELQLE